MTGMDLEIYCLAIAGAVALGLLVLGVIGWVGYLAASAVLAFAWRRSRIGRLLRDPFDMPADEMDPRRRKDDDDGE